MTEQISNKHFEREAILAELLAERNRMVSSLIQQLQEVLKENQQLKASGSGGQT